ncbi:hypothetical protein [Enterococcus faecium]|uniref:hypothetical protein n=1 Tax=Enterococcus faecium TaxID=1352 RepID=UPI00223AF2D1|nr:hypothetical protein [Enterococcus faecium]MCS8591910.1 hypothetical protein [Enterococcus faecium]
MRQKNMFLNIFMVLLVLIAASFVISLFVSVVSGLLWFAVKVLIPIALIIWLVRWIKGNTNRKNYY